MHAVWLKSFPTADKDTFERIVRKQKRTASSDETSALLDGVSAGSDTCIRAFAEEESAENLAKDFQVHGGTAEVREGE